MANTIEVCTAATANIEAVWGDELAEMMEQDAVPARTAALTIDNGCSHTYAIVGTQHELLGLLAALQDHAVSAIPGSWSVQRGPAFIDGYASARRFYGDNARAALDKIERTMKDLRAEFPTIPAVVERYLTAIDTALAAAE